MAEPAMQSAPAVPLQPGIFVEDAGGTLRLAGTRCRACGAHFFPRRQICARCLSADMETVPLGERGILYTYTVVHQAAPGFPTPYILGYADLPDGVRVLAPLADIDPDEVQIGMPVILRVEPVRTDAEGRTLIGYRWHRGEERDG